MRVSIHTVTMHALSQHDTATTRQPPNRVTRIKVRLPYLRMQSDPSDLKECGTLKLKLPSSCIRVFSPPSTPPATFPPSPLPPPAKHAPFERGRQTQDDNK